MPMLDQAGRQLIALRNGLGRVSGLTSDDAQLLAHMQTDRQARAVLGVVAQTLQKAYAVAEQASGGPLLHFSNTALRAEFKRSLDNTNRWAQKTYAGIPDDDAPLSLLNRKKVEETVIDTRKTVTMVTDQADDLNRGFTGALADTLLHAVGLDNLSTGTKKKLDLALKIGIGIAALIGLIIAGKLVYTIALGNSGDKAAPATLGEAEAAAVAIMDARRRKRRRI